MDEFKHLVITQLGKPFHIEFHKSQLVDIKATQSLIEERSGESTLLDGKSPGVYEVKDVGHIFDFPIVEK